MVMINSSTRTRCQTLLKALSKGLYERDTAIRLSLLTAVAGESIFLLGPPGVGKSLIARRLKYAFRDGVSFEYLMSKFTTPDEIFGPISIKKLKEEDKYERLTDRYLPGANIVFLDEIWKAGPAIQNALLTILNEKIYRNGTEDLVVQLRGIITASNELPPKNKSLEPIWDRFLVRLEIGNIKSFQNFVDMIVDTNDPYEDNISTDLKFSEAELNDWSKQIDIIEVPAEVLNTIQLLTVKIEEYNASPNHADHPIQIYDRRWKKAVRLMRTSAFLNGRAKVDLMDCFLLEHCLWNHPDHQIAIREMLTESIRKHGYSMAINLNALKKEVAEFEKDVAEETQIKNIIVEDQLQPLQERFYRLIKGKSTVNADLITIDDFRKLKTNEDTIISFYDENQNLLKKIRTQKGKDDKSITLNVNGELTTFQLQTSKREHTDIIYKKPHQVVLQFWEERMQKLNHYIQEQQKRIKENAPDELNHLEDNLFVDTAWSKVVQANLTEVNKALEQLSLRLEKLEYNYANIEL